MLAQARPKFGPKVDFPSSIRHALLSVSSIELVHLPIDSVTEEEQVDGGIVFCVIYVLLMVLTLLISFSITDSS